MSRYFDPHCHVDFLVFPHVIVFGPTWPADGTKSWVDGLDQREYRLFDAWERTLWNPAENRGVLLRRGPAIALRDAHRATMGRLKWHDASHSMFP